MNGGDPNEIYPERVKIGEGGFSSVYLSTNTKTQEEVAIKVISVRNENFQYIIQELANHKKMKHANVVDLKEAYYIPKEQQLWVILGKILLFFIISIFLIFYFIFYFYFLFFCFFVFLFFCFFFIFLFFIFCFFIF